MEKSDYSYYAKRFGIPNQISFGIIQGYVIAGFRFVPVNLLIKYTTPLMEKQQTVEC